MLVVETWDGRTALALRNAMRLSGGQFAAKLGVSSRGVEKWEGKPYQKLAPGTQQLLDVVLEGSPDAVKARFGLALEHANAAPAAVEPLGPLPAGLPQVVTPDMPQTMASALRGHYLSDNLVGPRATLPIITATADVIDELSHGASGQLLDELLSVGAAYAEFAGWLSQDTGDEQGATAWYRRALEMADTSGDVRMSSFVLMRRAVQIINTRDGRAAARLAKAAQRDDSPVTARVRAIAAQTEALGHAIARDADSAKAALDQAEELITVADSMPRDGDPSDGRYCEMPLYLAISRAKVDLELNDADAAISAFGTVLEMLPPNYHRDRGQYLARLARAHVLAEHVDEACARAEEALMIATATGSTRTTEEVRRVCAQLSRWASSEPVVRLNELLARSQ